MSTPSIRHHFEYELVVPGTPQQVWQAIATADGINSWMLPTELDARVGGKVRFDMAPGEASHGIVTAYDENNRLAYEEDWATLAGHSGADVTPLATEFLIEAQSGGTCVVRVVSSAYGTGAEWEHEFWSGMDQGWTPMLDHLRTYLAHFAGERATNQSAWVEVDGTAADVLARTCAALGVTTDHLGVGNAFDGAGLQGSIDQIDDRAMTLLVDAPFKGYVAVLTMTGETTTHAVLHAYSFGPTPSIDWQQWIENAARGSHG